MTKLDKKWDKTYLDLKGHLALPDLPSPSQIVSKIGECWLEDKGLLLPTSPISDIIDSKPTSPETVTFPNEASNRDTIDSITSNLNKSDESFDSTLTETNQSTESVYKIDKW